MQGEKAWPPFKNEAAGKENPQRRHSRNPDRDIARAHSCDEHIFGLILTQMYGPSMANSSPVIQQQIPNMGSAANIAGENGHIRSSISGDYSSWNPQRGMSGSSGSCFVSTAPSSRTTSWKGSANSRYRLSGI